MGTLRHFALIASSSVRGLEAVSLFYPGKVGGNEPEALADFLRRGSASASGSTFLAIPTYESETASLPPTDAFWRTTVGRLKSRFSPALAAGGGQSGGERSDLRVLPLVRQNKVGGGQAPHQPKRPRRVRKTGGFNQRIVSGTGYQREVSKLSESQIQ